MLIMVKQLTWMMIPAQGTCVNDTKAECFFQVLALHSQESISTSTHKVLLSFTKLC